MMCQTLHRECTFAQRTTKRRKIDDGQASRSSLHTASNGECKYSSRPLAKGLKLTTRNQIDWNGVRPVKMLVTCRTI